MTITDDGGAGVEPLDPSNVDELFDVLSDSSRRFVIACLGECSYPLTIRDLAARLTAWKRGEPVDDVPLEAIETSYLRLYHVHVPKLAAANLVEFDEARGTVALREREERTVAVSLARAGQ